MRNAAARLSFRLLVLCGSLLVAAPSAPAAEPPQVLLEGWTIEAVAVEPDLVTPISCRFDRHGRLLVVESHTHFPPDDYQGPESDRIYIFDDTTGDGRLDRRRIFFEGGIATMGLAVLDDDWVVVATRSAVVKIRDSTGDDVADEIVELLRLETAANYPHNGLSGLALGPDGYLYVGQGENFGEPYTLVGSDGSRQDGSGEGGNVFRCRPDGSSLQRWATGFWNPFGLHFDAHDRLWAVDNDPDARPPCRLLHVVRGADFGFQFRFGRAGTHPLQGWEGDQPGTLPLASGTGEAPCAVITYGDALWVSSWGDNRIERFRLESAGGSWSAKMETVVQGGADFRPVDFAVADDGSIYVTDWVDRSYPVHGKGRLWRLIPDDPEAAAPALPPPGELELAAGRLLDDESIDAAQRLEALDHDDPFVRHAAAIGLLQTDQLDSFTLRDATTPGRMIGLMAARRWRELIDLESADKRDRAPWISHGLSHTSPEVNRAAIRWAVERGDEPQLPSIKAVLTHADLPDNLFASVIAGIAYLESGSAARGRRDPAQERLLGQFLEDRSQPQRLRRLALRMLPAAAERPSSQQLAQWASEESDAGVVTEAVRLLVARGDEESLRFLREIVQNEAVDAEARADALAALARSPRANEALLRRLADSDPSAPVGREATRALRTDFDLDEKPPADDLDAWEELIGDDGDHRAGHRVFARTTCINCHTHSGRGAEVGPDLTTLGGQTSRRRILESILQPSKEVAPLYVTWSVVTVDGRVITGVKVNTASGGNQIRLVDAEGRAHDIPLKEIASQQSSDQSVMPEKLYETMTIDEMRDLVAFLAGEPN